MKGKLFLYFVVVLIGLSFWLALRKNPYERALQSRQIATRVLGEELARRYPGSAALIFSNPFAQNPSIRKNISAIEEAGIEGLREGFGKQIKIEDVVYPAIRPEAVEDPRAVHIPDTTTPLSYLVAEDAFDQLAEVHPECELLVSLIGLPARLDKLALWNREGPPRLALLLPDLRMVGSPARLREAVASGKLAAFVLPKPGAPTEQTPVRKDYRIEFEERYILVNETNLDQVLKEHPQLFHFGQPSAPAQ